MTKQNISYAGRRIRLFAVLLLLAVLCGCGTEPKPAVTGTAATEVSETAKPVVSQTPSEQEARAQKRAETQIGIWYSIWYNVGSPCFWDNDGGPTQQPIYYKPLLPDGTYGRYDSADPDIIQYHLREMTEAGIDFIIMDQTNDIDVGDGRLNRNSQKMARAIWEWNKAGNKNIKYCSAIGAMAELNNDLSIIESEAQKLWERYCTDIKPWGTPENHMYVDGKPLLVLFTVTEEQWNAYKGDKTYTDKFTLRYSVGHAYEPGYWGWVMPKGTQVTEDVACVIPGWYKFNHPYEKVYRERGSIYRRNWETVLESAITPRFIVINSFNEYAEHTAVFTASTADFPKNYPIEGWIDGAGNEAPSLYWDLTKEYIAKYRNGEIK